MEDATSHQGRRHGGHGHAHHAHGGHGHHGHLGHADAHAPANFGRAFAIGIALNAAFVVVEAGYGFASNSMALVADAGHNLSDVLGLVIAWVAAVLAAQPPSRRFTYGLRSSSILAALANALLLLVAIGAIAWEAVQRLLAPEPVAGLTVTLVALVGIAVNGITAWLFASGRRDDLNIRGAFLHMAADAAVSAGVVIAGLVVLRTGWDWIDPAVSLAIVAVILWSTWSLLRDSVTLSMNAVPPGIEPAVVRSFLAGREGVQSLHDLHIWGMSTRETALTAHLVMPGGHPGDAFLMKVADELNERFDIGHVTLQVETDPATRCRLEPDHIV